MELSDLQGNSDFASNTVYTGGSSLPESTSPISLPPVIVDSDLNQEPVLPPLFSITEAD
jgi:hypothetical protein